MLVLVISTSPAHDEHQHSRFLHAVDIVPQCATLHQTWDTAATTVRIWLDIHSFSEDKIDISLKENLIRAECPKDPQSNRGQNKVTIKVLRENDIELMPLVLTAKASDKSTRL